MSKKKWILFGAAACLLLGYLIERARPSPANQETTFDSEVDAEEVTKILQSHLALISVRDAEAVAEMLAGTMLMPDNVYRDALRRFGEQCIVRADVGNDLDFQA